MEPPINSWRPIVISCYNQTRFTDGKTEAGRGLVILPGPHTEDRTGMPGPSRLWAPKPMHFPHTIPPAPLSVSRNRRQGTASVFPEDQSSSSYGFSDLPCGLTPDGN